MTVEQLIAAGVEADKARDVIARLLAANNEEGKESSNEEESKENESNEEDDDDDAEETAGQRAYNRVTRTDMFPSYADCIWQEYDNEGNATTTRKCMLTINENSPFPSWPTLFLQGDIDSIYSYNRNIHELFKSFSKRTLFQMRVHMDPGRKAYGSRYFVDCTHVEEDIIISGRKARKVPLHMFPNIEIGHLYIPNIHRPFSVYLHNLNVNRLFKENRFDKSEMAVINAAINLTRAMCLNERNLKESIANEFHDFTSMHTTYGAQSKRMASVDFNSLNDEATLLFTSRFKAAIELIANNDVRHGDFSNQKFHGISSDNPSSFSRNRLATVANQLLKGLMFSTSISGIKKLFHKDQFQRIVKKERSFQEKHQREFTENIDNITSILNEHIRDTFEQNDPDFIIFSRSNAPTLEQLYEYDLPLHKVSMYFPDFELDFDKHYKFEQQEIIYQLQQFMTDTFGVMDNRSNPIFFDIGMEIRMRSGVNMLIDLEKAYDKMKVLDSETG